MRTLLFLFASAAFAQTDPQPLQALLNEVHQLRLDLQTTAVTMQRVQIVLYRMQSQTTLASRAAAQSESARTQLGYTQDQKKNMSTQLQQLEESLRSTQNPTERKHFEDMIQQVKLQSERITSQEQRLQSDQIDADARYRTEQAKLTDLQDQLDRLDKVLDTLTRK
jgi:chromosome segregation ATPase